MASRIIRSHRGSQYLLDTLVSFIALEAIKPSREIYIVSPWISNAPLINGVTQGLRDVFPFAITETIRLADVLGMFAWAGSKIRLICDPSTSRTQELLAILGTRVEYRALSDHHEKGFVTDNFYIHGSMNFTFNGIHINGECVRVTTDLPEISSALLAARSRWEESE